MFLIQFNLTKCSENLFNNITLCSTRGNVINLCLMLTDVKRLLTHVMRLTAGTCSVYNGHLVGLALKF